MAAFLSLLRSCSHGIVDECDFMVDPEIVAVDLN
jgi:hypothetical protein